MDLDGIDAESVQIIIRLQLQDIQSSLDWSDCESDETADRTSALRLYESELRTLAGLRADQIISQNVGDGRDIRERDAEAEPDGQDTIGATAIHPDSELLRKLQALHSGKYEDKDDDEDVEFISCTVCGDRAMSEQVATCPCSHKYCHDCIAGLFNACIMDESLFPPRCCSESIPLDSVEGVLPLNLAEEFRSKCVEFSTANRTYCYQSTCSAFIPPSTIDGDFATCSQCESKTCSICKGESHEGDCPEDSETQEAPSRGFRERLAALQIL
jgi:hypothetical protein